MESILSSLSKVSISKSFFYALSLFHSQSCPQCIHTSEKWKGPKKNDLEFDTIDNDDENDSLEVGKHDKISKYSLQVQQNLRVSIIMCPHWKSMGYETKTPNPTPPSLKTVEFWQFFFVFSDLIFRQKLEDKKSFFFFHYSLSRLLFYNHLPHPGRKYFVWGWSDLILRRRNLKRSHQIYSGQLRLCLTWQIFYKQSQRDCLREHKTVEHKPEIWKPRDDRGMTRDASRENVPVGESSLYPDTFSTEKLCIAIPAVYQIRFI